MPETITVRVEGLRELGTRLSALKEDMQRKAAWSATGRGAAVVKKAAKAIIRGQSFDTGSLHDALVAKRVPAGQRGGYTAAHWVTVRRRETSRKKAKSKQLTAPHAGLVEFGTVKMQAEPYLRPALQNNVSRIGEEMRKKLIKSIDKFSK